MATISSPGLGSGLDVNSIVEQLVSIERRPIVQLEEQNTKLQARLSAFGLLQSYTVNVHDAVGKLTQASLWEKSSASSSDPNSVSATPTSGVAKGSYSINVTQLAQAQALASNAYASSSTVVGTGTLSIELGSWDAGKTAFTPKSGATAVEITIDAENNTLEKIRDAINAADAGVTAAVVTDALGARLTVRSTTTGEENAVRITATDDDGNNTDASGLSALAYDPPTATGQMSETMIAKNATATINGLGISSATNTLTGVVAGMNLTLNKVTTAAVEVKIGVDKDSMKKAVNDFVKAYNDINKYISDQTKYNEETKTAATLQGDRSTLSLQSQLRSVLSGLSGASSAFPRLSDIGIEFQRDGSLKVDDAKLGNAIDNNLDELKLAFTNSDAGNPSNDGFAVRMKALTAALTRSDGLVSTRREGLRDSIRRNELQAERYETRVAMVEQRLLKQYTALDVTLNQLNGLNSSVTQQLEMLAATYKKK